MVATKTFQFHPKAVFPTTNKRRKPAAMVNRDKSSRENAEPGNSQPEIRVRLIYLIGESRRGEKEFFDVKRSLAPRDRFSGMEWKRS
jgi:hypothetical protein